MDFGWVINLFGIAFDYIKNAITMLLNMTLFKVNPDLVDTFSSTITLLVTFTAIYIILVFVTSAKKILGIILLLGWVLLIASMFLTAL
ncbi:MAG TPA: hypothetical protein P5290_04705 [Candidatus Methanomethylicus sp.]|jgi:hypothetical protein|nr:hypothetical protein [Candidatus Methanomethylicus sp.]HRR54624.1 hypothetical protein [Candidatus Methanomethylicus sp.]